MPGGRIGRSAVEREQSFLPQVTTSIVKIFDQPKLVCVMTTKIAEFGFRVAAAARADDDSCLHGASTRRIAAATMSCFEGRVAAKAGPVAMKESCAATRAAGRHVRSAKI